MAHNFEGEPTGFVPRHFYLEFDLVVELDIAANGSNNNKSSTTDSGTDTVAAGDDVDDSNADGLRPMSAARDVYQTLLRNNLDQAKDGLLALLEQRGVPVLDTERLVGGGHQTYLAEKCVAHPAAAECLEDGEPVPDRFWQLQPAPATVLCPAPVACPVPDADGRFDPATIDYRYAGMVLRSPVIKCSTLPMHQNETFRQDMRSQQQQQQPPVWVDRRTNPAGVVCSWREVQYVLHLLDQWSHASPLRELHIANPGHRSDDSDHPPLDNGTNTALRILFQTRINDETYMSLLQMKKVAAFMWFFEAHFQHLCHPRQKRSRVQSPAFPSWSANGPLAGVLWRHSVAAALGVKSAAAAASKPGAIDGHLLHGLLQYVPRTMFDEMVEYRKLAFVFVAVGQGDLCRKLQMVDSLPDPAGGGGSSSVVPSIGWPVLGTYRLIGFDHRHRPVPCPIVAIGGFQTTPFDVDYYRHAAQLAHSCVMTSVLSPAALQAFLTRVQDTSLAETDYLVTTIGADAEAWGRIMETYPNLQETSMELDHIDIPYDDDDDDGLSGSDFQLDEQ